MSEVKGRIVPADYEVGGRKPQEHLIKTHPAPFAALRARIKTAELRLNDRDYREGDVLICREYLPDTQEYTGSFERRAISHVQSGFGLKNGYVMLSFPSPAPLDDGVRAREHVLELLRDASTAIGRVSAARRKIGPIATQAQTAEHCIARARTLLSSAPSQSEVERLREALERAEAERAAYRLVAINQGWNWNLCDAYGREEYERHRAKHVDDCAQNAMARAALNHGADAPAAKKGEKPPHDLTVMMCPTDRQPCHAEDGPLRCGTKMCGVKR